MAAEPSMLTKTDKNLWNAIVSEALAYLKYNAYAHKALEEGHPEVAQVFQEVRASNFGILATNIFVRRPAGWRMIAHHASPQM